MAAISSSEAEARQYQIPLAVVTILFFMWGFLTCLNDILVPHLKGVFDLNYTQVMLIQFTFFTAYFVMSIPAGKVIARFGYQKGIVIGLLTAAAGALLFYPAAGVPSYPLFLTALFVLASGITLLQVAANPYVTVLGKPETASSRLNLTQAFNSLGTTVAPFFGGVLILSSSILSREALQKLTPEQLQAHRLAEASSVQLPYVALAVALGILAFAMAKFKLPVISTVEDADAKSAKLSDALKSRHLGLGAIAIFVYVGAEVSIGSFLVNFLGQPDIAGLPETKAAGLITYYWGGAMIGRFIGSGLMQKVNAGKLLGVFALVASALVLLTVGLKGETAMWTILAVGLFNSIMFPTIFALGVHGLGRLTSQGSSVLVMAIVGGAIIPLIQGILADNIGIQLAFVLPAICYLYIAFYGFVGSKPEQTTA